MKKIEMEGKSYDWCKNALARFRNVDQTSTQLAPAEKRTVEKKGEKQVRITGPPEEKTCFTLTLTVGADGAKYPAIVVFKTSSKTGKIPSHVLKRYNIPENVIVMGSRSGWWTKELDDEYIHLMYPENQDAPTFLLRDHAPVHTRNMAAALLKKKNVTQIFVPNCRTDEFQPLGATVNRAFQASFASKYHAWMSSPDRKQTKTGNAQNPSKT